MEEIGEVAHPTPPTTPQKKVKHVNIPIDQQ